ncbi:MAG: hypothetical protein CM1200mP30_20180 [Pseudomonadota bacterium]|nr:MAG: hypothetical protein CM1200mP30_20180 [Pseudomonadota bacterium]
MALTWRHLCQDWLGIKAKGQQFTCRVSDWWRREGEVLVENWVFVDLIDMLKQLDYDVFEAFGHRSFILKKI